MSYHPTTDPYRQWDPYAVCPACGCTLGFGWCMCDGLEPTLPLIPSERSWSEGTALLPTWSDAQGCWVSSGERRGSQDGQGPVRALSEPDEPLPPITPDSHCPAADDAGERS